MNNLKVDILIPYWGDLNLLKKTVSSVLNQTSDAWHATVVDDCYPDPEVELYFDKLADDRISYLRHPENIGITNNFNFCIKLAKADYCVILGCDDKLLPSYVESALKNIGHCDFYQPAVEVINAEDKIYLPLGDRVKRWLTPNRPGIYEGEKLATSLSHGNWLYFPSIMWKTATLKRYSFEAKYKVVEDVALEFDMIIDGAKLYLDSTTSFQYRRFANSVSSKEKGKNGVRFKEEDTVYSDFAKKFESIGWNTAAKAARLRVISLIHRRLS